MSAHDFRLKAEKPASGIERLFCRVAVANSFGRLSDEKREQRRDIQYVLFIMFLRVGFFVALLASHIFIRSSPCLFHVLSADHRRPLLLRLTNGSIGGNHYLAK